MNPLLRLPVQGLALCLFALPLMAADPAAPIAPVATLPQQQRPATSSVIRVNSTNQNYNFVRPWEKRPPYTRRGVGVILPDHRVLVTAELVGNHTYVELEKPSTSEKSPADVEIIDYEANLALLKPQDPEFLAGGEPVETAGTLTVGDTLDVLQIENNGAIALTPAVITTIAVSGYPVDGVGLLIYKTSAPLQYRDNSFCVPVFQRNKLAGMLMRYDTRTQTADLIPDPVIESFLERAASNPYRSFPRAGIAFSGTRDPQFRRYLGMNGEKRGVYISSVSHGSSGEKAGLKKGDVLLSIGGHDVDPDGNYEHPDFGKVQFSNLIATEGLPGQEIPVQIYRDGKAIDLELPLEPLDPATIVSEPYWTDKPPRYQILAGLIFQELSRPFLQEWGNDWRSDAPQRLVYLDAFQDELSRDRGKIVFLNQVLPADATIGYEDLSSLVVECVNGKEIKSLDDLAEAVKKPVGGFHKIEFDSDPGAIYLDASQVQEVQENLLRDYNLPASGNL